MNALDLEPRSVPATAILHDKSDNPLCTNPAHPTCSEDREVHDQGGARDKQRSMAFSSGMAHADTAKYISHYSAETDPDTGAAVRRPRAEYSPGAVDMKAYRDWIKSNGYNLGSLSVR